MQQRRGKLVTKPRGVKIGRKGAIKVYQNGVLVKALSAERVLGMIGRRV